MTTSLTTEQGEVTRLETQIKELKEQLAKLRRETPRELIPDVDLKTPQGTIKLSELFGARDELILIHNMGKQCVNCTMWADGFNGVRHHLEDRAAFVVMSADEPQMQKDFAESRGWKFKMVSSAGTNFAKSLGFEIDGQRWPGVSAFTKSADGKIYRHTYSRFGPGDNYCTVWDLFDLLPKGVNDWEPKYKYTDKDEHSSCCH